MEFLDSELEFGTTFFGLMISGVWVTFVLSGIEFLSMEVLTFHTRFFFEDFEKDVFHSFLDLLDDTLVLEGFVGKMSPSDYAIKTMKHSEERCFGLC